jgi:hypothetical protein
MATPWICNMDSNSLDSIDSKSLDPFAKQLLSSIFEISFPHWIPMGFHSLSYSRFPYGISFTTVWDSFTTCMGFQVSPESPNGIPSTPEFLQNWGSLWIFSIPLDPFWDFFHLVTDLINGFFSSYLKFP